MLALDTVWALLRTQNCCIVGFSAGLDCSFPRIWCNNDRIDKCQRVLCVTLFITICCDIVNISGQVQLVLRHTWLWVVVFNDAVSSRDCILSNGGMIHYFERMWQMAVVGLICGTIPAFA